MSLLKNGNPYQKAISNSYVGTVFFDVCSLNPMWPDCSNRDVDPVSFRRKGSIPFLCPKTMGTGRRKRLAGLNIHI